MNDIVIAINKLRIKFNKVLYIDLDVHHGKQEYKYIPASCAKSNN